MVDEKLVKVYEQLRVSQDKYTYFILAAAASAIALAINKTENKNISLLMIPLGAALLSWGVSFYYGCRNINYVNSILYANVELLNVQNIKSSAQDVNPQLIEAAIAGIKSAINENNDKSTSCAKWQFGLFIIGAVLYLIWQILSMLHNPIISDKAIIFIGT